MSKNIVVCCDGTSNEYAVDRTNVLKLFFTLVDDPTKQVTFYHPGLGTMGPPGAITHFDKWWTTTLGLAIGYGLSADIRDAYVFLAENFEADDRVFLFGFSRGAYTVRCLASVLRMYGLIRRGNGPLVPYAIRMMNEINKAPKGAMQDSTSVVFNLARGFKETFSRECKPHFVGVWDTVSSVGWIGNQLHLPFTANNADISVGRHAVAIDEHRAFFRTNLWRPDPPTQDSGPRDLKQVWFAGDHCDVGGGWPEGESGLSKLTLEWMLGEARAHKLVVDSTRVSLVLGRTDGRYAKPDPNAVLHDALQGKWTIAEYFPKRHFDEATGKTSWRANYFGRRKMPPNALVHDSVFARQGNYADRIPKTARPEKTSVLPGP